MLPWGRMDEDALAELERITRSFDALVPLNRAMGMELLDTGEGRGRIRLPWDERWLGDPERGLIHGGVITTLLDATCGIAAFMALHKPSLIATLDLRIDHLRPAVRDKELIASAETVRRTRQVLFIRGIVDQGDPTSPVATATATFAIT
jgi:uncharacterized protein (TIGR00369 family)